MSIEKAKVHIYLNSLIYPTLKMQHKYLLFALSFCFLALVACKKTSIKKQAVQIQMRGDFVLSSDNPVGDYLSYSDVQLKVEGVRLVAKPEDGTDLIEYIRDFDQSLNLSLAQNNLVEELNFALPARKYNSIQLFFELDQSQNPALVVKGTFTDQGNQEPILIEFNNLDELEIKARQNGIEDELDFSNLSTLEGSLTLNPAFWTNTLAKQRLIMADRYLIDNIMTIYIDEQHNQQLYQTIVNRVDLKNYLEF